MTLLLAAVQAVKVVNFPPTPKPDTSSLDAAWQAVRVGGIGDGIAVFAVVISIIIAVVTLNKVNKQLRLNRESNDAVLEDLEYSRKQVAYISRKAKLELCHNRQRIEFKVDLVRDDVVESTTEINLWLFNDGDNTARDCTLFLWLPAKWKVPNWNGILNPAEPFKAQGLKVIANVPLDGKRYWYVAVDVPFPTYPGMARIAHKFEAVLPVGFEGDMLWRIGYDDGIAPPANEPEGRLRFELCNPNKYEAMPQEMQDTNYEY